jgi:hypothetical protein
MKRLMLALALMLGMLGAALPAHAAGAMTSHFSFRGQFAEAFFSSLDASGCVATSVDVFAVDGRIKMEGSPKAMTSSASMLISQFDTCTETLLLAADGFTELAADAFQIDQKITAARLNTTIEVFDFVSGTSFPVDVSVSWTGAGNTSSERHHDQIKAPGFTVNSRFSGTFRDATAAGTVSDGTTNFTLEPAVFADMRSVTSGDVVIIHG